ncbi:phage antirepressor N-terminal domain-containing protein [Comamonas sp. C11]|uniref:phage antirepressor N-terminal domain-containing protein n=1 Tax=Comamonas sp. C11 TaxID=2966554 RepID=UPI0021126512|nr:phage antirepressor N-terminal domain-containing protein [Comamonas sp. C11]UUC92461.1 phage antirepressor N-terminal domain-containing protein [Comamonas sp. C11]UUC92513.1 phage antirepressor N-terminal domain-containing protein [Comamonas sp. C11]
MSNSTELNVNRAITVPFLGAELYVVDHNSQPYAPMKPIITGMGLTWHGQHAKIKANANRWGVLELRTPSAGGMQDMLCMPLRKLPGWLSGIESGKVKSPEARAKVIQYQNECDDVLWQYWNEGIAINPRQAFAVNPGDSLTAEEAETLRLMLKSAVERQPKAKQGALMMQGWSKLKAHFKVGYREIPRHEFSEAVSIIARHTAEFADWEVVDGVASGTEERTINVMVDDFVRQIETPNGTPTLLFMPLVNAVLKKQGFTFFLPSVQEREIMARLDRLSRLFHPSTTQFMDVTGIVRVLQGLHPKLGTQDPSFRQLVSRITH